MKKLFLILFGLGVLLCITVVAGVKFYVEPRLKPLIEQKASEALGTPVTLGAVKVQFWPPVVIVIDDIKFALKKVSSVSVNVQSVLVSTDLMELIQGKLIAVVNIENPKIKATLVPDVTTTKPVPEVAKSSAGSPLDEYKDKIAFGIYLKLDGGDLEVIREKDVYKVQKLSVDFKAPNLKKPWNLSSNFMLGLKTAGLDLNLPFKMNSEFKFDGDQIDTQKSEINIGGIALALKGSGRLSNEVHDWTAGLQIPDLKSLPIPPAFLPDGQWSGGLMANVHATHEKGKDWRASGQIGLKQLSGQNLNLVKADMSVKGGLTANADVNFTFDKTLTLNKLLASADMSSLDIAMKGKFNKPSGVRLAFDIDGDEAQNQLTIKKGKVEFADIKADVLGKFAADGVSSSNLSINVPKASLKGLEKFFPALATSPLQGSVEVKAQIDGNFQKPETLTVNINPLLLENVKGQLQWSDDSQKEKHTLQGPVSVNARVVLIAQGKNLKTATVAIQTDLSQLAIAWGDTFQKKAQWPLKINIAAKQKGKQIQLTSSDLTSSFGKFVLKGTVSEIQAPVLNLKLDVPKLDLGVLTQWVPMMATYKLSGQASSGVTLVGKYDFAKGVQGSDLTLKGSAQVNIPQFNYKSTPAKAGASGSDGEASESVAKAKAPEPILPPWPLFKNLSLKMAARIGNINFNDMTMNAVKFDGTIGGAGGSGILLGNLGAQGVFGGSVNVTKIKTSLLQAAPTTHMNIKVVQLDIARALAWGAPTWKDMAKGIASGDVNLTLPHPSRKDFITASESQGQLNIAKGWLSTLPFDDFVNQKLSKIPGIAKKDSVKTGGAGADLKANYVLSQGKLNFSVLNVLTPERNELQSQGWVRLVEKDLDLNGNAYIATSGITGPFLEANADPSGRLMVPVHITGSVFKPDLNIADTTIKQMVDRMAKNETNKFKKKAEESAKKEVQKQVDQQKSKLEEEAKKLFKF